MTLLAERKVLRGPNFTVAGTLLGKSRCRSNTRDFMNKNSSDVRFVLIIAQLFRRRPLSIRCLIALQSPAFVS
jgi:hypothetical protein